MPIQRRGRGEDILFCLVVFCSLSSFLLSGTPPPPLDGEPASPQRPTRLPPPLLLAINEDIARLESLENIFACSFVRSFAAHYSRFVLDFARPKFYKEWSKVKSSSLSRRLPLFFSFFFRIFEKKKKKEQKRRGRGRDFFLEEEERKKMSV